MSRIQWGLVLKKPGLVIRTVLDLKPGQVFFRLVFMGKRQWRRWRGAKVNMAPLDLHPTIIKLSAPLNPTEIIHRAEAVLNKELTFLNQTLVFDGEINWDCPGVSRLWGFNLQYMSYVIELAAAYELTGDSRYLKGLAGWIRSWMAGNVKQTSDAWHPYPVSVRTVNWILAAGKVWPSLTREFREEWLGSLLSQLRYVQKNLEYDLRGNHLLANCKALLLGGIFLGADGAGRAFYQTGRRLLESQLQEQILADGGHFERSPMYHCLALEDFLTLYDAFIQAGLEPSPRLRPTIQRMIKFLQGMLLPDRGFPLFNDAAFKIALPPSMLFEWAKKLFGPLSTEKSRSNLFCESGYARLQIESGPVVIFNCGAPSPRYQPGHAHADTLSFEWALKDGTRVLVDPGVDEYQAGPWRDYFRSTGAHNTMKIDGANSTEVWGGFRAGRKARICQAGLSETNGVIHAFGEHDGYRFLPGRPLHRRDLWLIEGGVLLIWDTIRGTGRHRLEVGFHLHPEWRAEKAARNQVDFYRDEKWLTFQQLQEGELTIDRGELNPIRGWYAPEFGKREPIDCIVWERTMELPAWAGFVCYPAELEVKIDVDGEKIELEVNQKRFCFNY
jgi:uncharacterized heparinase superfamily protein